MNISLKIYNHSKDKSYFCARRIVNGSQTITAQSEEELILNLAIEFASNGMNWKDVLKQDF
jgi:hypothetical protein